MNHPSQTCKECLGIGLFFGGLNPLRFAFHIDCKGTGFKDAKEHIGEIRMHRTKGMKAKIKKGRQSEKS